MWSYFLLERRKHAKLTLRNIHWEKSPKKQVETQEIQQQTQSDPKTG